MVMPVWSKYSNALNYPITGRPRRGSTFFESDVPPQPFTRGLVHIPMKAASDPDGKAATHPDPKRPLFQRSDLAGVIFAVG